MLTGAVAVEVSAVNGSLELDAVDENCASSRLKRNQINCD